MRIAPPVSHKVLMNRAVGGIDKQRKPGYTVLMINDTVAAFFSQDVVGREGFILSADTCNPKHIGPKLLPFVKAFDFTEYSKWMSVWGDYVWGTDSNADSEAYEWLVSVLDEATNWACHNVPGMMSDTHIYQFAYSDYDGALLGWWSYPLEG